jgi:hypothetical protein
MNNPPDNPRAPSPIPLAGVVASGIDSLPAPRRFTVETMQAWIAEDEADFERLRLGAGDP